MMYSFILLSLVVAVYCHQPVPELYDADKYEAKVKRLDEVEELIDRVTTRIQNLKDKRELRQKQKDDADRRSKSILLRLDRMKLNDGSFHCDKPDKEFKCRKNTQCVNNILVCDNVPDCEDKSDEDPDLCKSNFVAGDLWTGKISFWTCSTTESGGDKKIIHVNVNVDNIQRSTVIPSYEKVHLTFSWNIGDTAIISNPGEGWFNYGSKRMFYYWEYAGAVLVDIWHYPDKDTFYVDAQRQMYSEKLCGQSILKRNAQNRLENFV